MRYISYNKNHNAVWITLGVIFSLGASYFFMYIPQNEKWLQAQRFRTLRNIDSNIHKKVENSVGLMQGLLKKYPPQNTDILNYIKNYNQQANGFILSKPRNISGNQNEKNDTAYSVTLKSPKGKKIVEAKYNVTNKRPDTTYDVVVNRNLRKLSVSSSYTNTTLGKPYINEMITEFTVEQFIATLLPANVFDQYILFYNGQVIYEDFRSGVASLNDSFTEKKSGLINSSIKTFNASGKEYKLFLQPVNINTEKQLVIAGLISSENYQSEIKKIPYNGVLLLMTIAIIAIVAYPWIKLYQMGNTDRLTTSDGIATAIVSLLLMSLLFFTFIKYNTVLKQDNGTYANEVLGQQITKAFINEIDTVYKKIRLLDSFKTYNQVFNNDIAFINNDYKIAVSNDKNKQILKSDTLKKLSSVVKNIYINQILWLDENGIENVNWTKENLNAPHGEFAHRDYFKNIVENKPYLINNDTSKRYYLDQVISYTSGTYASVMSIRSADEKYITALSFDMQSIKNSVLPEGYQFAIIDSKAKVLYHSNAAKNLNENLLDEFSEKEKLRSCIESRSTDAFTTKYFSKEYNLTIKPINNLPYFIVILYDTSFKETRDVEIYSFTFSMMFLIFIFFLFQLSVILLVSSQRSKFKKEQFNTNWIAPKISAVKQYYLATIFNILVFIIVIIFYNFSSILTYIYVLLFSITITAIFLNALFAKFYQNNNQPHHKQFKINAIYCLSVFIIIINWSALRNLEYAHMLRLWAFEILTFIVGYLCYTYGEKLVSTGNKYFGVKFKIRSNYAAAFTGMVFSKLILTSGLPVIFFYTISYNYEQHIGTRYRQLKYEYQLPDTLNGNKIDLIKNRNYVVEYDKQRAGNKYYYLDSSDIYNIGTTNKKGIPNYTPENKITINLLRLFRINISSDSVYENKFYISAASDNSFFFNHLLDSACIGTGISTIFVSDKAQLNNIAISSSKLNYKLPLLTPKDHYDGVIPWILLIVALLLFYFIIYRILNKLFCLSLPDLTLWEKLDHKILENTKANNLLFVIGLPGSGKLTKILKTIEKNDFASDGVQLIYDKKNDLNNNVIIVDLINIPDIGEERERDEHWENLKLKAFSPKYKLMIINHFEYNIQDSATSNIKLNFLEQILIRYTSKVIILSTIHPVAFLDSIISHAAQQQPPVAGQDLERWHVLLGHFRIIVYPLEKNSLDDIKNANKAIFNETMYTHFLQRIQNCATGAVTNLPKHNITQKEDEMIFKLQVTGHYFYMYIWQSLTKEEKFILYDLAEDSLVNSFDEYNLNMLRAKGVIINVNGTLKLFNRGFRNFILTAIGNTEARKIKSEIEDNGNWSKLKNPLLIIIGAIIIFLIASQEEAYSKLLTYVAALGAGIPTILKLFSLFDKGNSKS